MPSFSQFGVEPSFLSLIVGQATIVLIACSILLTVVKDIFEVRAIVVGPAGAQVRRIVPCLATARADHLRVVLRLFSFALPTIYAILSACVFLVERSPLRDVDGKQIRVAELQSPFVIWDKHLIFALQDVYYWELIFHLGVVVIVAIIFYWMVRIRRDDCAGKLAGRIRV
jgi:hypothetical protein